MKTSTLLQTTNFKPRDRFEKVQIDRFGERYIRYREQLRQASELEFLPNFPLYLMLEQTFKCNLTCPSCIQGYKEATKPFLSSRMTDEMYIKIIDEARVNNLPSISMHVNDEPLLVKNLAERIAIARDAGIMDIIMTTNGNLLDQNRAEDIIEAGVTHILFSIDAATDATYQSDRPGGTFSKVVEAVNIVNKIRGSGALPLLRASMVLTNLNAHERDAFHDFWGPKVDYIEMQAFGAYKDFNANLATDKQQYIDPSTFSCSMPFGRLTVRGNGDVIPCCSFYGYELVVGNISDCSLQKIWRNAMMTQLRDDCIRRDYSMSACQKCVSAIAVEN